MPKTLASINWALVCDTVYYFLSSCVFILQEHDSHLRHQVLSPGITSVPYSELDTASLFWYGGFIRIKIVPAFVNRTGHKYGKLTVLELDQQKSTKKRKFWICICECGNKTTVLGDNLKGNKTKSCGCLQVENQLVQAAKRKKWGKELLPTRHVWQLMWRRCKNPKDGVYKHYGAKGIKVCEEWKSFDKFLEDMGIKPEGLSLERKDVNGNYCPENCCWATTLEQSRNRTNTKWITIVDQTKSASEWCEIYNISQNLFGNRVARGWDPLKALIIPPRPIPQDWRNKSS